MLDGPSTSAAFAVAFLGALFAILAALLVVYTYVVLRLLPKLKRGLREMGAELGPSVVGTSREEAEAWAMVDAVAADTAQRKAASSEMLVEKKAARVIFVCEDHGRCGGCPKVLAQFEAIIRHQGEDTFDEVERTCYAQLRDRLKDLS
jgi:hypothetical protein